MMTINKIDNNTKNIRKRRGPLYDFFSRLFKEKLLGVVGLTIVVILLFAGIFAPLISPYDYTAIKLIDNLQAPSTAHWLGTDSLGRDVLSRIIYGARISVIIGLGATLINLLVATFIGAITGFFGGKFDMIVQRFVDAWMAIPSLLILMTVMSMVGRGMIQMILVLGISWGIGGSRIPRSAVMAMKENTYISASKAIGLKTSRTLFRHILPNIAAPLIIMFTTSIGGVILTEASLSFLGFGLPPDVPSWGGMLSYEGRKYMEQAPYLAIWPGLALSVVVWGANMFGDALRDLLDPRLRGGIGRYSGVTKKLQKLRRKVSG